MGMPIRDVSRRYYAMKTPNSFVETRNFSSTSKDKRASLIYSDFGASCLDNVYSILLIFEFSNLCNTAIDLLLVPDYLLPISEYQDDEEVLILPYTLF
ncbi:unnamed protein product [Rotaria sordida]|uniref:Uncharacterized protein n=1 Tax=Rotaria sordida TaxID=392033 RepID=A0A815FII0_9BILA|nr:unnamed protein product [Rotaria sordida]CAF3724462.1 unnamed protein product [Rotaria sordida]CAF4240701.1 unnamed protein product [Rotaria sordida]